MSGFGYNVLGFGASASTSTGASDDEFNRVSFLGHFDGANDGVNNAFDDGSTSNHTITAAGNITQGSFGPFARPDGEFGVSFDSAGDYLTTPYSSDFNFGTGSFTIEAFVFPKDLSGVQGIYATSAGANAVPKFVMHFDGATPKIHINALNSSGSIYMNSTTDVAVNAWTHIAFVRNGSTWYWFINGTGAGTGSNSTNITFSSSEPTTIGYGGESYFTPINGLISNLRVINGTALYTGDFTAPTSKLTAVTNTKLLTCQSNRFVDNSASAHTLTPAGNPAVTAFGPFLTSAVYDAAVNGASAYFDGDGDYLSFPDSADWDFGTGDFTVEGWVNPASDLAADTQFIGFGDGGNGGNFGFEGTGQPYFYHGGYFARTSTALNLGSWSHIAFVRSSGTLSCYINGTSQASSSYTGNVGGTLDPRVGAYSGGQYFKGYMQDIRILKGTAVYTGNFTPPTAPLTAITNTKLLLNMADGQAIDSAAQKNLTLYGNAKISTGQAKFGNTSLLLDGTGDFAQARDFNDLAGPFTIEAFARADDTTNAFLWCLGEYRLELGIEGDDLRIYRVGTSTTYTSFFTGGEFTVNNWHHVALVRDTSNVIKCYLNGTASSTTITDATAFVATNNIFIIGGEYGGLTSISHGWDGYVDEFRISDFARYTSNFTAPSEPFADKGQ